MRRARRKPHGAFYFASPSAGLLLFWGWIQSIFCAAGGGGSAGGHCRWLRRWWRQRLNLVAGHAVRNLHADRDGHLREPDASDHVDDDRPIGISDALEVAYHRPLQAACGTVAPEDSGAVLAIANLSKTKDRRSQTAATARGHGPRPQQQAFQRPLKQWKTAPGWRRGRRRLSPPLPHSRWTGARCARGPSCERDSGRLQRSFRPSALRRVAR